MKVTRWFPKDVKPVRKGVYETYDFSLGKNFYNYFDGDCWYYGNEYLDQAISIFYIHHDPDHKFKWRGLTRKAM